MRVLASTLQWPSSAYPMIASAPTASRPRGPLERFLRLFTDVRDGEGPQLLLLALNVFLILTAYYVMKPVREALILDQPRRRGAQELRLRGAGRAAGRAGAAVRRAGDAPSAAGG